MHAKNSHMALKYSVLSDKGRQVIILLIWLKTHTNFSFFFFFPSTWTIKKQMPVMFGGFLWICNQQYAKQRAPTHKFPPWSWYFGQKHKSVCWPEFGSIINTSWFHTSPYYLSAPDAGSLLKRWGCSPIQNEDTISAFSQNSGDPPLMWGSNEGAVCFCPKWQACQVY